MLKQFNLNNFQEIDGCVNKEDLLFVLDLIDKKIGNNCGTFFQFGYYLGHLSHFVGINFPNLKLICLDLPVSIDNEMLVKYRVMDFDKKLYKMKVNSKFMYKEKCFMIFCDSAYFDSKPFHNQVDIVFIDGAHSYEYVQNDTFKAIRMVNDDGLIIWHDYIKENANFEVYKFIEDIRGSYPEIQTNHSMAFLDMSTCYK